MTLIFFILLIKCFNANLIPREEGNIGSDVLCPQSQSPKAFVLLLKEFLSSCAFLLFFARVFPRSTAVISHMMFPLPLKTTLTLFCIMVGNAYKEEKKCFYCVASRHWVILIIITQQWVNECSHWAQMEIICLFGSVSLMSSFPLLLLSISCFSILQQSYLSFQP